MIKNNKRAELSFLGFIIIVIIVLIIVFYLLLSFPQQRAAAISGLDECLGYPIASPLPSFTQFQCFKTNVFGDSIGFNIDGDPKVHYSEVIKLNIITGEIYAREYR